MKTSSSFARLSARCAPVYCAETLAIEPFFDAPIVLGAAHLQRMAFALSPTPGYALEFGVFQGKTLRRLARANPHHPFFGFDSFIGLPEPWRRSDGSTYDTGHFTVQRLPDMPPNVKLVQGFYEQTLQPWLDAHPSPVRFVHVDCDLYSSTRTILHSLTDRLAPGAVILFDELSDWQDEPIYTNWREGEWQALQEWLTETGFQFRILGRSLKYQAAIQVWREPPPHGQTETLACIKAVWDAGARAEAVALLEPIWADPEPWLPAAHCSLGWRAVSHPGETLKRVARIWKRARLEPDADTFLELYLFRSQAYHALKDYPAADQQIRKYIKRRPYSPTGLYCAARVAKKTHEFERARGLFLRWHRLTGDPRGQKESDDCARLAEIRPEYRSLVTSALLVQHLLDTRRFDTVLDIGSGAGVQAAALRAAGKQVTEIDYGMSRHAARREAGEGELLVGNFMNMAFDRPFDCVLASHVLEHQADVGAFLRKIHAVLREGGVLGLTVPPLKNNIVGGHLTLWNAGLVLYNLVIAGFDCRRVWVRQYGYNISVALEKSTIVPAGLVHDSGDIERIAAFLPEGLGVEGFDGDIRSLG